VTINLATGQGSGGHAAGDILVNINAADGSAFNDSLSGNAASNSLSGLAGNDTLAGLAGYDTLTGGQGNDCFDFTSAPAARNSDRITDFVSGTDKLRFDDAVHSAIGVTGNFTAGDGRFWSAPGATAGHDADDRVIYDSSTGSLYYDADGSGAGAALLVATFQGNPIITATDIAVI
jgi:Ca2+-binding RTX toxin-like protein